MNLQKSSIDIETASDIEASETVDVATAASDKEIFLCSGEVTWGQEVVWEIGDTITSDCDNERILATAIDILWRHVTSLPPEERVTEEINDICMDICTPPELYYPENLAHVDPESCLEEGLYTFWDEETETVEWRYNGRADLAGYWFWVQGTYDGNVFKSHGKEFTKSELGIKPI